MTYEELATWAQMNFRYGDKPDAILLPASLAHHAERLSEGGPVVVSDVEAPMVAYRVNPVTRLVMEHRREDA